MCLCGDQKIVFWKLVLSSFMWVCGDQSWIIRHEENFLYLLNYFHWSMIIFNGSLVKISLALCYLAHCYFLHEGHYTAQF